LNAHRIAAAARELQLDLEERLALFSDALARSLAEELELVAWDREQLVGGTQARIRALRKLRHEGDDAPLPAAVIVERRRQPLESLQLLWAQLRSGRSVELHHEPGVPTAYLDLVRGLAMALPGDALLVAPHAVDRDPAGAIGVESPLSRIAVIDRAADRELAAYVLARSSLRRAGQDPRAVRHAWVTGSVDLLKRHMGRLWVGVQMGPATDPESFAGPVRAADRDAYLRAHAAWSAAEGVDVWCSGGELERTGSSAVFLAPSAFAVDAPAPDLPIAGPMIVVVRCEEAEARRALEDAVARGASAIRIGGGASRYGDAVKDVRGALLVERLPPGLPEPRPV
jgi:hypothetical protein